MADFLGGCGGDVKRFHIPKSTLVIFIFTSGGPFALRGLFFRILVIRNLLPAKHMHRIWTGVQVDSIDHRKEAREVRHGRPGELGAPVVQLPVSGEVSADTQCCRCAGGFVGVGGVGVHFALSLRNSPRGCTELKIPNQL